MPPTTITDVRTVGIGVRDQDAAVAFFVGTLGFEKRLDAPISREMRWEGVPPMYSFDDPDGNRFYVVEEIR